MKQTLIKILFITVLLYPLFSYSEDINKRGLLAVDRKTQLVHGRYYLLAIGIDNYINLPKLNTAAGESTNSDNIVAMVAEKERITREENIERLKKEEVQKKVAALENDIEKYTKVAKSEFGKEYAVQAWNILLDKWEVEKGGMENGDIEAFIDMLVKKDFSMEEEAGILKTKLGIFSTKMIFVKGGCYQMGDTFGNGRENEKPVHEVCVDDFYIGKYEITVGEFKEFIDSSGYKTEAEKGDGCYLWNLNTWKEDSSKNRRSSGFSQTDKDPVICVSWNDANKFIEWQSKKWDKNYRLPTEAEWEYAARSGGKKEKYAGGNDIDSVAWYNSNSGDKTHPAGQKQPNGLGIYDMTGNVWEWVNDWYDENYYKNSPKDNPKGPSSGEYKVLRGGAWVNAPLYLSALTRAWDMPARRDYYIGFRLALSLR